MPRHNALANLFEQVLNLAADRLFLHPIALARSLDQDGCAKLYGLSTAPDQFGTLRPNLSADDRQQALAYLLTAARAYIVARRKSKTHASNQIPLPLTFS